MDNGKRWRRNQPENHLKTHQNAEKQLKYTPPVFLKPTIYADNSAFFLYTPIFYQYHGK
jgi:hypothetical protein